MSRTVLSGVTVRSPEGRTLLDTVDLSVSSGELCVLGGRNGAGKTLLARCIAGLTKPDEGRVRHEGPAPALVFQDTRSQVLGQTVEEDVALGPRSARLAHPTIERRVSDALDRAGLSALRKRDPLTLSGGEQRRLSIAALLALRPEILILDEPFSSLDFEGVRSVLSLLVRLYEEGHGLLVITHDLEKICAHATRLVLIDGGRIRADAAPETALSAAESCGLRAPRCPLEAMTWLS